MVTTTNQIDSRIEIPPIPFRLQYPQHFEEDACQWLDDYVLFSRKWSPISYDDYHEACGLFLLSTVAARRVAYDLGKKRYTNLYIALVSRTSIYAKTSVAEIATETLSKAGLDWLLLPDNATPQWVVKDMASAVMPDNFDQSPDEIKQFLKTQRLIAGQRGWFFDEFGMQISAMMRRDGVMSDFRGLLRKFDDTPKLFSNATIGRGNEVIYRPYLSLLVNFTPSDLKPFATKGAALWGDGYLARFALVTPPAGILKSGRFPNEERIIPSNLLEPIKEWHKRLGMPEGEIKEINGSKILNPKPKPPVVLEMSEETYEAYYDYFEALREIVNQSQNTDLDGNYSRLAEKGLRIAALFASLGSSETIDFKHWAKAQAIVERWRIGTHELYEQVAGTSDSSKETDEEKILRTIRVKGKPTRREIQQSSGLEYSQVDKALETLLHAGKVSVKPNGKTEVYAVTKIVQ